MQALTNLVQSTATQEEYNTIVVPAQNLAGIVDGVESDLAYWASACPPYYVGQTTTNPQPYCTDRKVSINQELNETTIQQAYGSLEVDVKDNPNTGFRGMLHLYSLWLGQSKQFFRAADSAKMQNLYDFWDAALTQAANLKIEVLHESDTQEVNPPNQLTDFMGNPDASPPTTGLFQGNQAANLQLMFPPVPTDTQTGGTTVISTQDHTMWSLVPWVHDWPPAGYPPTWSPQAACQFFNQIPIYANSVPTEPSNGISSYPYAGFYNWQYAPSKAQWQAAVSLAPTNGSVQWGDWLTQQTQTTETEMPPSAGFFNWNRHCSGGNGTWTSTQTTPPSVWNINLVTNSFQNWTANGPWYPARTLAAGEQYFWYQ